MNDAAQPIGVHQRDEHGDGGGEEDADDDAGQEQRVNRQSAARGGDHVHGHAGHEGSGKGEGRQPQRLDDALAEPGDLRQHHPERRARGDPEDGGLGERIPGESLEAGARHRERSPRERRRGDSREAYPEDDHALRALHGPAPHHEVDDGAGGHARAAHEEREERHQAEHQRETRAHRQELPRPRHLTKASGWMSLASDSMPSTTRGP